jgi:hypothetical protein
MAARYNRNKQLVDLSMTPTEIKEAVIESYEKQLNKDRSQLLNYFIKYRLKNMMDVLEDF